MPEIDYAELRAEIELEREWRESEMRLLRNQIAAQSNEEDRRIARKALVVMLYAHFEGECKAILAMYVARINRLELTVSDVASAIGAASMSDIFGELRDPGRKCPEFRSALPDDTALHRFARDKDFVESVWEIAKRSVEIDVDNVVDTESNLKPVVLRKILFRLGLGHDLVSAWEGNIHRLLNMRNDVAHGTRKEGYDEKEYRDVEEAVRETINKLVEAISGAVISKAYAATKPPSFPTTVA